MQVYRIKLCKRDGTNYEWAVGDQETEVMNKSIVSKDKHMVITLQLKRFKTKRKTQILNAVSLCMVNQSACISTGKTGSWQPEVQSKMEEWEDKIGIFEEIVFARLLLKGAEQNSINIKAISEDPFSIYVECKQKKEM